MQSFRTEIENPVVERDIIELEKKIRLFKDGKVDEERFRSLRLARGVYGQRQAGVQMIRIKIPYGRLTGDQLLRIADVSDEFSTGRLHITTRQDIQIHYVSLDRTPELWAQLEKDDVTLREACGNTVRNITASETTGIDPKEAFDVSPYADAMFTFFLRNPVNQEMGRKFKISFSNSEEDTALSYIHDLGFIAKIKDGKKGFKVLLGGGLGSQPRHADVIYEFLETDKIIPLTEGVLRIFDRYGERSKRLKARMKFLIKDIGVEEFVKLVAEEQKALAYQSYPIDEKGYETDFSGKIPAPQEKIDSQNDYERWKALNVIDQKQKGYAAIGIKVHLGDFYTDKARELAVLIKKYAANELRLSLRQDLLIPHVKKEELPFFYNQLTLLGLTELGYNSTVDITACPGTDTCNLGIASSTGIASKLEKVLHEEYPQYIDNKEITIKISGCMNACGQHNMAEIGFQGMSVRTPNKLVAPALQVLLGGGILGDGKGQFADKVIKVPSKRGPQALRLILDDYEKNSLENEKFVAYYNRQGQMYFYDYLKPLSDVANLEPEDFIDWGHNKPYIKAVGVGECAGVVIDLVATLLFESEEKLDLSKEAIQQKKWSDSIYHSYTSMVNTAKALLLGEKISTNTQASIIRQFNESFIETGKIDFLKDFEEFVYQIKANQPTEEFALKYNEDAQKFYHEIDAYRKKDLEYATN